MRASSALASWVSLSAALASWVSLSAALAFAACTDGASGTGTPHSCTLIGCGSAVSIKARLPGTFATIRTYAVEVCRNGHCISGSFARLTDPPPPGGSVGVTFPDPVTIDSTRSSHVDAMVSGDEASGFRLQVQYWPWNPADLLDGDRYVVTVRNGAGKAVMSLDRTVTYETSYPNGKDCGPVCENATIDVTGEPDAGAESDAGPSADASAPPACVLEATSSLPHVRIVSKATTCVFTLAEARAGITIPYDVVIDEDVPGFAPDQPYPYGPNVSALFVSEMLRGGTQAYCLCDQGLPYASCPEADGGISRPHDATPCEPTTLKKGVYPRAFTWDGVNWTGPSDTGNPKGPPFPRGDYTLTLFSSPGKLEADASASHASASTKLLVRLVP